MEFFQREGLYIPGLISVLGSIVLFIIVGIMAQRATKSSGDYYMAGASVGPVVNAFAIVSAYLSLATFIGFTAMIWNIKSLLAIMSQGWMIGFGIMIFLFSGPIRRLGTYTAAGYISTRFASDSARLIGVVFMIFVMIMYTVSQMKGIAHIFELLFGISYVPALFLGGIIVVLYVTFGGMYGVTWNQAFQGFMCVAFLLFPVMAIAKALGASLWWLPMWGYGNMTPDMLKAFPTFFSILWDASPKWYIGVLFSMTFGTMSVPHYLSRISSAKNIREGRMGFLLGILMIGCVNVLTFTAGFAGVIYTQTKGLALKAVEADKLLFILSDAFVGNWALALILAGAIAAGMSTVAGALMVIGTGIAHDVIGGFRELTEKQKKILGPTAIFISGVLIMFMTISPPTFALASVIWAIILSASVFTAPLIMGIWWKGANKYGVIAAMLIGGFFALFFNAQFAHPSFTWSPVLSKAPYGPTPFPGVFSVPISFVVMIFVSMITNRIPALAAKIPREKTDKMVEFMHGWPDHAIRKDSTRYASDVGPAIIGLIMLAFCIFAVL
jgi:cation/acetate symporter